MKRLSASLALAFVSICSAEQPTMPKCEHDGAVACFVDRAQANLRLCLSSSALPSDVAGTSKLRTPAAQDYKQRQACVAASHRDIEPLYQDALAAVRYQRGNARAVQDYYADWKEVLARNVATLAVDSTAVGDIQRADIERLNVKAEHLRQGR